MKIKELTDKVQEIYSAVSELEDILEESKRQVRKIMKLLEEIPEEESDFEIEAKEE